MKSWVVYLAERNAGLIQPGISKVMNEVAGVNVNAFAECFSDGDMKVPDQDDVETRFDLLLCEDRVVRGKFMVTT